MSIWNVAWIARTIVVDPLHVFDANIFYPHRWTLAYSETNLGAGLLAVPVYWLTRNAVAAHNFVVLASFVLSATGTYFLVRYLVNDRRAAAVSAISFAYCPYLFGHIPHIQLLMTAGLPFSLLAFHRLADRPSARRGAVLGLAMSVQALFCAYYGVFLLLLIGYASLFTAISRRTWADAPYWRAIAVAAGVAGAMTLPLALPHLMLRQTGFSRSLDAAREYSALWQMYFVSTAYAHAWMMPVVGRWSELLFPGFVATLFGVAGAVAGWSAGGRSREISLLYVSVGVLAIWLSFGPDAGLYRVLYAVIPLFDFMRAPGRFGVLVALALSVLAGSAIAKWLANTTRAVLLGSALVLAAVAELLGPFRLSPVPPVDPAYHILATLPRGPVIELPIFSHQFRFLRARYMLSSTTHWMPLVNAYSDYIPPDFIEAMPVLADFPSLPSFKRLERDRIRYAVFHLDQYSAGRDALETRLKEFAPYLRRLHADGRTDLYEIVAFPP